jgi:hypothetical protein
MLALLLGMAHHIIISAGQPTLLAALQADTELAMFTDMLSTSIAAHLVSMQVSTLRFCVDKYGKPFCLQA